FGTEYLAWVMQDPSYAQPTFINATGNGQDRWKEITYTGANGSTSMHYVFDRSRQLFNDILGHTPDLSALREAGTKLIIAPGLADGAIPPQGAISYYEQIMER